MSAPPATPVAVRLGKDIQGHELAALLTAVGWGEHGPAEMARAIRAWPATVHARVPETGALVGYLSAFSDSVSSTWLGELVVHPDFQRQGIATRMLRCLESHWPGLPVTVSALGNARHFFIANGYQTPRAEMTVLFKKPSQSPTAPPA
ncbi:MAG: GNAT family N-acetyltransferase [Comamonadaceae bacterium]|nr:GNAT family N-acetyltransferase [Comamonadaceae bacterium]RRD56766.1 N-acetyltransferase [Comamonadaceae bacterium OH2545_COT-014]